MQLTCNSSPGSPPTRSAHSWRGAMGPHAAAPASVRAGSARRGWSTPSRHGTHAPRPPPLATRRGSCSSRPPAACAATRRWASDRLTSVSARRQPRRVSPGAASASRQPRHGSRRRRSAGPPRLARQTRRECARRAAPHRTSELSRLLPGGQAYGSTSAQRTPTVHGAARSREVEPCPARLRRGTGFAPGPPSPHAPTRTAPPSRAARRPHDEVATRHDTRASAMGGRWPGPAVPARTASAAEWADGEETTRAASKRPRAL